MYYLIAGLAGCLLAGMIFLNGALASHVGAVEGSFLVHGVGLLASIFLLMLVRERSQADAISAPAWSYLGGAFGGLLVVIVGVTVNSELGVSGTVAMLLLGQILTGWLTDLFGLFGHAKRRLGARDLLQVTLVMAGSGFLLHG